MTRPPPTLAPHPSPADAAQNVGSMRWSTVFGVAAFAAIATIAAWWLTELAMSPSGSERVALIIMFALFAFGTAVVAGALQWFTLRSLDRRILATALVGPLLVAIATLLGARSMFISSHDTQFVIILVVLAATLAVAVVQMLARPLMRDLETLRRMTVEVGQGNLDARAELTRQDEVGELATAFNQMTNRLARAEHDRDAAKRERSVMLASLGHDARTPLAAMRAALEAVQDGVSPDPERYLASIEHDLTAVEDIIDNIFLLGRIEAGRVDPRIEELDLEGVAWTCVEALTPLAQKNGVRLGLESPGSLIAAASRPETQRILHNLMANAIRHAPEGGSVSVALSDPAQPTIDVTDTGDGFAPSFVEEAFEQFTRSDEARVRADGGAGLGLAVARGLVLAQGGSIRAFPGPGGRVQFTLPASALG